MTRKLLEPHVIAVSKGMSLKDAIEWVRNQLGETRYWVYHDCCEPPVTMVKNKDEVGEDWECPECQRECADEVTFSEVKLVDEDQGTGKSVFSKGK